VITVGTSLAEDRQSYSSVTLITTNACTYCMPDEQGAPIYLATKPILPVARLWPHAKHFN
jgi:hypothetical protein